MNIDMVTDIMIIMIIIATIFRRIIIIVTLCSIL